MKAICRQVGTKGNENNFLVIALRLKPILFVDRAIQKHKGLDSPIKSGNDRIVINQ